VRRVRCARLLLAPIAVLGLACTGDPEAPTGASGPPTSADDREPVCARAQDTVGAADPPADLVTLAADAARVADLATAPDEPLRSALVPVSDAAVALTEAARAEDPAGIADAAATLTAAYDELDRVAASMEAAECTSESWGRQVAIAAIDLVGAGG
jgi:hypothetical protein